jgi:hypothetical protein
VHPPNPQLGLLERRVRPLGALPAMGDGVRPANTRPIGRTESATVLFDVGGEWHSQRWQLLRPHGLQPLRPHSAPFAPMHPPEQSSSTQSGAFPGDFSMTRWDVLGRLDAAGRRPAVVGRRRPIQRKRWRSGPSHTTQQLITPASPTCAQQEGAFNCRPLFQAVLPTNDQTRTHLLHSRERRLRGSPECRLTAGPTASVWSGQTRPE